MDKEAIRTVRRSVGLFFGLAGLIGVAFFELRYDVLSSLGSVVFAAYISFLATMFFSAVLFSRWYVAESGLFEVLAVPTLVLLISALSGGLLLVLAEVLAQAQAFGFRSVSIGLVGNSLVSGAMFLVYASPVLLPAVILASVFARLVGNRVNASKAA